MSTMPNLVAFSWDSANIVLSSLGVTPVLSYQAITPPATTPGLVISQNPAAGQTISGPVSLTLTGAITLAGRIVFSQPANIVSPITSPG